MHLGSLLRPRLLHFLGLLPFAVPVAAQAPVAEFSGAPLSGSAPLTVTFQDLSTGTISSWMWDFGDGNGSLLQNPVQTYFSAGSYTVSLTVSGPGGTDTNVKPAYIVVTAPPAADFTGSPTSGTAPLTVAFNDASTGVVTSWNWTFGDGGSSTLQNPSHTYTNPGTYTVALTVVGPTGSNTRTRPAYIQAQPAATVSYRNGTGTNPPCYVAPPPVLGTLWTAEVDSSVVPGAGFTLIFGRVAPHPGINTTFGQLLIDFTSPPLFSVFQVASGGIDLHSFPFPNNTAFVGVTGYTQALVTGPGMSDQFCNAADLTPGYTPLAPPPTASFSATPANGLAPLAVAFGDTSTGAVTSWTWDFGDGSSSTLQHPSHTYAVAGTYTVSLVAEGPDGFDAVIVQGAVQAFEPVVAAFDASPTSGFAPLLVSFSDLSTGPATAWSWDFGDLGTSTAQNPTHTYAAPGTYTVSLTVTGPGNSDTSTQSALVTVLDPAPVANFLGSPQSGVAPLTVTFSDLSPGLITAWSWDFGDGGNSTLQDPTHTYALPGTYTVSLTVTGPAGTDTAVQPGYVTVLEPPPTADFAGLPTSGFTPLAVQFTDLTTGSASAWSWDFGDGGTSTLQNPSYTYTLAGTYTVSLTATGPGGSDTAVKPAYVVALEPTPAADFSGSPTSGTVPLTVAFTDLSGGNLSAWSWDFGDGGSSTLPNPTHTYTLAGTYDVALTVSGPGGTDTVVKPGFVTAVDPPPTAAFTGTPQTGTIPLAVQFSDQSSGPVTAWSWDFGDGGTSTLPNPTHTYTLAGTYDVALTASGPGGSDTALQPAYIVATEPPPVAAFTGSPLSGPRPLAVAFTDQSTGTVTSWSWSFGDGNTSTQANPSHVYLATGTYDVTLSVSGPGGSDTALQTGYITVLPPVLGDGSFEAQTPGLPPSLPWTVTGGSAHLVLPDSGVTTDGAMPTQGSQWAAVSGDGSTAATPPSNPGGTGSPPAGAVGISQDFSFDPANPVLVLDAAFLLGGPAASATFNDFASVDVTDGTTTLNVYYADTFNSFPDVSARFGLPMTTVSTVSADLAAAFPAATSGTLLTLQVQVGNGGDGTLPSLLVVDDARLLPHGSSTYRNGSGFNPPCYTTAAPVIGTTWTAEVDATALPGATTTVVLLRTMPSPPIPLLTGELLVPASTGVLFNSAQAASGGVDVHTFPLPPNVAFVGSTASSQGMVIGANSAFCNAADLVIGFPPVVQPPLAAFSLAPASGPAPLTVGFTDASTGTASGWTWHFGDATTSTLQNPTHTYTTPGTYDVYLVTEGPGGFDVALQVGAVQVQ